MWHLNAKDSKINVFNLILLFGAFCYIPCTSTCLLRQCWCCIRSFLVLKKACAYIKFKIIIEIFVKYCISLSLKFTNNFLIILTCVDVTLSPNNAASFCFSDAVAVSDKFSFLVINFANFALSDLGDFLFLLLDKVANLISPWFCTVTDAIASALGHEFSLFFFFFDFLY